MPNRTENDVQTAVWVMLQMHGFVVMRINSGMKRHVSFARWIAKGMDASLTGGVSDILAVAPNGRMWAIEVKRPGAVESEDQRLFLDAVKENAAVALVIDDEEVLLEELQKRDIHA
jgi:hypothetical protein